MNEDSYSLDSVAKIKEEINSLDKKYLLNGDYIVSDYQGEEGKRKQYIGRQIFELLQNADDCHDAKHEFVSIKFELSHTDEGYILAVKNTGMPFSVAGVRSLLTANVSSKEIRGDTIGNKGLGFRSVLNWSNEIEIITKEFVVAFSEKRARENLERYKRETNLNREKLDSIEKNRTAILASATLEPHTDRTRHWLEDYDTSILLHCNEDCVEEIERQLRELQFEEMLFLKHINKVDIVSFDEKRIVESVSEKVAGKNFEHVVIGESDHDVLSDWHVWRRDGEIEGKDGKNHRYEMALAYNSDNTKRRSIREETGRLYSYFRTDVRMPFPYLIHATFDLTEERNNLEKGSEYNGYILDELVKFIAETSVEISKYNGECDYSALSCLIPGGDSLWALNEEYHFSKKLTAEIPHLKILPTISNEYISLDDMPMYSEDRIKDSTGYVYFADILNKNTFCNLLKICHDKTIKEYFASVKIGFYQANDLDKFMELIDNDAEEYVESGKHIPLIKLLINKYGNNGLTQKNAPKLIVDSTGNRITESDVKVFNNPKDEDMKNLLANLPDWCQMRFLDPKIEDAIDSDSRSLVGKLKAFGCVEYAFEVVMDRMISQSAVDKGRICELLKWLYMRWLKDRNSAVRFSGLKTIDRNGDIKDVSKCYLGEEYDCIYEERITKHLENVSYVASNEVLGIGEGVETEDDIDPRQLIKGFLISLGAKTFPEISRSYLHPVEADSYRNYNSEVYPVLIPQYEFRNERIIIKDLAGGLIYAADIIGMDTILENADFADILYWMLSDGTLRRHLATENELPGSYMTVLPPYKQRYRRIDYTQMRSWLLKRISSVAWLPVKSVDENRTKVCFDECTLLSHNLSPLVEVLSIDDEVYEDLAGRLDTDIKTVKRDVDSLLKSLGVAEKFIDLPKEKIYSVMYSLSEIFPNVRDDKKDRETVQGVYSAINQAYGSGDSNYDFNKLTTENGEYNLFSSSGKIMAKKDDCFDYFSVKKVFYDDGRKYCADILNNYPIFQLNRGRTGNERFQKLFGIRPLDFISVVKVESSVHDMNARFRKEYMSLLPYVFARRISNINRENERTRIRNQLLKNEVVLSKQTTISYSFGDEESTGHLKDFESVTDEKNKVVYIEVPEEISDWDTLRNNQDFQRAISDVVIAILDIESDTDGYCLIFSKSAKDNERFFNPHGDDELIGYAKESFKDPQRLNEMFWNTLSGITGTEAELLRKDYGAVMEGFDFLKLGDISDFSNLGRLRTLFSSLGTEVLSKYNESELASAYGVIDFGEFNRDRFRNLWQKYANKYFTCVARKCKTEGKKRADYSAEQGRLYSMIDDFADNSADFDEKAELERYLGISLGTLDNQDETQLDSLVMELSDEVKEIKSVISEETQAKIVEVMQYDDTKKMVDNIEKIPVIVPNTFPRSVDEHPEKQTKKTSKGGIHRIESDIKNVKNGGYAERVVYEKLKNMAGPSCLVEWKSGYAEEAGVIGKGEGDDSLGYDIHYYDNENAEHFVDVKSISSSNIVFNLSSNEYKFAQEQKANYDVWVVLLNNGPQKIFRLDKLFLLDDDIDASHGNKKFSIDVDNYVIKYFGIAEETE